MRVFPKRSVMCWLLACACVSVGACGSQSSASRSNDFGNANPADVSNGSPGEDGGVDRDAEIDPDAAFIATGALTHACFARTQFGATPNATDADWAYGGEAHRFTLAVNAGSTMKSRNPAARSYVYGQHWNAIYTAPDSNTTAWSGLAASWASAEGANVEDIFVHAAVGQTTLAAPVTRIVPFDATTSTLTLGNGADGHQVLTSGYPAGTAITISGNANTDYDKSTTVTAVVSSTELRIHLASAASGSGGTIGAPGDGTKTFANRIRVFAWTDWRYVLNPGSVAGKAFSIYRFGQLVGTIEDGVFWDSTSSSTVPGASLEYASRATYLDDIVALLQQYRTSFPAKDSMVNLGGYHTADDARLADAAGSCQMEAFQSLFSYDHWTSGRAPFVSARVAAGTHVELTAGQGFDGQVPQAGVIGLSAAFRAGGGSLYRTPDQRAMMANYAAYLLVVDPALAVSWDPANEYWSVSPLSARWYAAFEYPIGKPQSALAAFASVAAGAAPGGVPVSISSRSFSATGAAGEPLTAFALYRNYEHVSNVFDATTAYTQALPNPPPKKSWFLLQTDGTVASAPSATATLQHVDGAIFVAR